jgi:hypothetical protein
MAIIDHMGHADRQTLCADFIAWLLTEPCQSSLYRASAFAVTDAPSGYDPSDPLAALDNLLRDSSLSVPPVFSRRWISDGGAIVRKFVENIEDAPTLWLELRKLLA